MPRGIATTPSLRDQKPASGRYHGSPDHGYREYSFNNRVGYQTLTAITEKAPVFALFAAVRFRRESKRIHKVLGYHAPAHRLRLNPTLPTRFKGVQLNDKDWRALSSGAETDA